MQHKSVMNDGCGDVVNMDEILLDVMCLVTTRTHINYKLLVLYRICYRVYTEITDNNYL